MHTFQLTRTTWKMQAGMQKLHYQRDSTHLESDVGMLLPTASTPSDTSSSQTGTRRSAGTLVRSVEAWLQQLSFSRSAKVGDHVASMHVFRTQQRSWISTYGLTNTWHQLWGSSTGCPSTVEWTTNFAPWCTQTKPTRRVPSPSTRWGPICDPPTLLNTLNRVVALRSASVRSHTPVLSPGTIFHHHSPVSLTWNVLGNI